MRETAVDDVFRSTLQSKSTRRGRDTANKGGGNDHYKLIPIKWPETKGQSDQEGGGGHDQHKALTLGSQDALHWTVETFN